MSNHPPCPGGCGELADEVGVVTSSPVVSSGGGGPVEGVGDAQTMADIALAGYERGEVSLTVLAQMWGLPPEEMQRQAADAGYWVAWMTPLLTEASGAAEGQLSEESLRAVLRAVPEPFLRSAGLIWALSTGPSSVRAERSHTCSKIAIRDLSGRVAGAVCRVCGRGMANERLGLS